MAPAPPKDILKRYLQTARSVMLWKLDGLSEYDMRRPMTRTGTNLLGMIKHLASVELGYFGPTFDRPWPEPLPWFDEGSEPNADLWVTAEESSNDMINLYRRAWVFCDETIDNRSLDDIGHVPWWPEEHSAATLHHVLIHVIAETNRHAGHADIIRELIDGSVGHRAGDDNMAPGDESFWSSYRDRLEQVAREATQ